MSYYDNDVELSVFVWLSASTIIIALYINYCRASIISDREWVHIILSITISIQSSYQYGV